jgi:hypothetical protein
VCPRLVRRAAAAPGPPGPERRGGMTIVPFFQVDNYTQALDKAYGDSEPGRRLAAEAAGAARARAPAGRWARCWTLANCGIAAGNFTCGLPKPWAYHPANFVPSNLEWAYQTHGARVLPPGRRKRQRVPNDPRRAQAGRLEINPAEVHVGLPGQHNAVLPGHPGHRAASRDGPASGPGLTSSCLRVSVTQ